MAEHVETLTFPRVFIRENQVFVPDLERIPAGVCPHLGADHQRIAGSAALNLRFEIFNLLNRTQFAFPDNNFNNATFGQILGTANQYSPRTLQAAVRISL